MGLFSFIGKAVKGIVGVAGKVIGSGLVPLPFGGVAGKLVGSLLHAKQPMATSAMKLQLQNPFLIRGKPRLTSVTLGTRTYPTAVGIRSVQVLPGGARVTSSGPVDRDTLSGGGVTGKRKRKRRRTSSARSSRRRSGRKRTGSRRLKFGSPAWRKKYLGHGRKRRRRRAA